MKFKLTAAAALIVGTLAVHGQASAQIVRPTCAQTWISSHKPKSTAKADGQACILGGKSTKQMISQADVEALLLKYITSTTAFVATPPADITAFCPKYTSMSGESRAVMWRRLFTAMVPYESGLNKASMMLDGDQYSIGLYQMSVTDGGCGLKREVDLVDPEKNIECAVAKMNKLASPGASTAARTGVIGGDAAHIGDGAAMYWRTLRERGVPRGATQPSRTAMIKASQAAPGCT